MKKKQIFYVRIKKRAKQLYKTKTPLSEDNGVINPNIVLLNRQMRLISNLSSN